jgi:type II secretory ATPase GspE/PulE/Tfp pilus assembly ATPase PilB-like protein
VPAKVDSQFLAEIRRLRSFSQACDLEAFSAAISDPLTLLEQMVAAKLLDKSEAGEFWSRQIGCAYVDPFTITVTEKAVSLIPREIALKAQVLPIYQLGAALTVARADPSDSKLMQRLAGIAGMPVSPVFSFPADVRNLLDVHYASERSLEDALRSIEGLELFASGADLSTGGKEIARLADCEQVINFLNAVIYFAMRREASDIHIEPAERESLVRYRIDGNLHDVLVFPRKLHNAVIARLKIMCLVDVVDQRYPTDGRFSLPMGAGNVDFRFSSIPSQHGEKAVVRILGSMTRKSLLSLDRMMASRPILTPFRRVLRNPAGIVFVIGPTGSGKTTTLYSALAELSDRSVNISTIEDPIELRLPGITQTQVHAKIDLDFSRMLRALLRQDPDVILIGEIRDVETARIAAEAALTGHLVLATLHANTAPEAVVRLMDMGIDPYLLAPTVTGILSQRLAARICENCKEPYAPSPEVLRRYFDDPELPEVTFYRGRGCHVCNQTGYKGRIAFHELLIINRRMRTLISKRASQEDLAKAGEALGYRPLRYDGLKKVLLGLTTIDEIEAQTQVEFED